MDYCQQIVCLFALLAQSTDTGLGTASGWTSAGLLGLVLGWLLTKHLPDKDKQIDRLIERHLQVEKEQRTAHNDWQEAQRNTHEKWQEITREEFKKVMEATLAHSERLVEGLAKALGEDLQRLSDSVKRLTDEKK